MPPAHNLLLDHLPRADASQLLAGGERVELRVAQVLLEAGGSTPQVWFLETGIVSLMATLETRHPIGVGMIGQEGMLGVQLALGVATSGVQARVLGEGSAWRVGRAPFAQALDRSSALRRLLARYAYVLMAQLECAAACQRFHAIEPRLARWLLMSQDRALSPRFHATHEILALMLGVRRVGVTMAAAALQRRGLIEYHRGDLTVLDRTGLESVACSCYALDGRVYRRVLG